MVLLMVAKCFYFILYVSIFFLEQRRRWSIGKRSKATHRASAASKQTALDVECVDRRHALRIVHEDKDLGTLSGFNCTPNHEVRIRSATSKSDLHNMRRILRNPQVPAKRHMCFVGSHIVIKSARLVCTWASLTTASLFKIHDLFMYVYRLIGHFDYSSAKHGGAFVYDFSVRKQLEACAPSLLLMMSRLILFLRIVSGRRWYCSLLLLLFVDVLKYYDSYWSLLLFCFCSKLSWFAHIQNDRSWISSYAVG